MKSGSWLWACLCIPVYLLVDLATGVTLTLTGSADYAVLDQTFRFTCTVTDEDAPTLGSLSFTKFGGASACSATVSSCSQNGFPPGYSCGCVSGQRDVYYMNISSVSVQKDEGTWRCERRSSYSNNITLPVYYGPFNNVTLDKSSPQRVKESSSLTVVCSSTCKPCSYTWRRRTVTVSKTKTLSLTNINRNQAGDYICTATTTALGTTASSTLTVDVQYKPVLSGQDSSYPVVESSPLHIDCSSYTTPGNPSTTSYRWTGPDSYTSTGPVLSISSISRTQTGQYTCTASNTLTPTGGPQQTGTARGLFNVDVEYLQRPLLTMESYEVLENETVKMTCVVESNPTAELTVRNIDNNTDVVRRKTNSLHFTILRAQCLHNGTFICSADNDITGRLYSNKRELIILCAPRRDYRFPYKQEVKAEVNQVASLVANIIANPTPVYSWYQYNNQQLIPIPNTTIHTVTSTGQNSILQITPRSVRDYGSYAVKVVNNQGSLHILFKLIPMTNVAPPATDRFDVGIGVGFAISLPIIFGLVIGLLVLLRKQRPNPETKRDGSDSRNEISLDQQITSPRNTYADLSREQSTPNEYEELRTPVQAEVNFSCCRCQ